MYIFSVLSPHDCHWVVYRIWFHFLLFDLLVWLFYFSCFHFLLNKNFIDVLITKNECRGNYSLFYCVKEGINKRMYAYMHSFCAYTLVYQVSWWNMIQPCILQAIGACTFVNLLWEVAHQRFRKQLMQHEPIATINGEGHVTSAYSQRS